MDKIIKVDVDIHRRLKMIASEKGYSMKEYVEKMLNDRANGLAMDVDEFSNVMLLAVLMDIVDKLAQRLNVEDTHIFNSITEGFDLLDENNDKL